MRFILFIMVLGIMACKSDSTGSSTGTSETQTKPVEGTRAQKEGNIASSQKTTSAAGNLSTVNEKGKTNSATRSAQTNYNVEGVPDACDLLSKETIARYVGQPAESIFLADGSSAQNPKARACFFKWDGSALANAGVMVQLQKNPVEEEVPEYFTYLISSKKTEGEKNPASGEVMKYKDWPGFGDDAAYSTEAGKYVWRIGNDWAFMVAFNTVLPPKKQKAAAEVFAREVISRMEK